MDFSLQSFSVHGILQARILECSSPADLPNLRIRPGSPALQADYLLTELPGKPRKGGGREEFMLFGGPVLATICKLMSFPSLL